MPTFKATVEAYIAAREYDQATLSRLAFWSEQFNDHELADITPDEVDAAIVRLTQRGRLRAGKFPTGRTGKPLANSTLNRYIKQLGQVYRYARRNRVLPRTHVPPTQGVEMAPERTHHDKYFTEDEIERLVKIARVFVRRQRIWHQSGRFLRETFLPGASPV